MKKNTDEDDKPTVVLDINALKKTKAGQLQDIQALELDIEFSLDPNPDPVPTETVTHYRYIYFNFAQDKPEVLKNLPNSVTLEEYVDLTELNVALKEKKPLVIFFSFEQNPKSINQLCAQTNAIFKHVKIILITKSLSAENKKTHQNSPAGAFEYITSKTTTKDLQNLILKIES